MLDKNVRAMRGVLLATSVCLCGGNAWFQSGFAQAIPQIQQQVQQQPGAIIQRLENPYTGKPGQIEPSKTLPDGLQQEPVKSEVENQIPEPRLDESLKRKLMIRKIRVEGATKLSPKEVQEITAPYENKESSFIELQENVADKLTALYEKKGYIASLAFIPPQQIGEDGQILIKADEGRVNEVTLQDARWFRPIAVLPRVSVKKGEPFRVQPLQNSLRRLNDNPDLVLQATLKAGKNPGDTNVVLTPRHESFFMHLTPFIDNLGRPVIGNNRYGFTFSDNNTLGLGDTAFSSPYWTKKSFGIINGYELPLGSHGTKLGFANAHTQFKLNQQGFNLRGNSNINTPYISQELFRNEHAILSAELGLAIKNSDFKIDDTLISQDKLRVLTSAFNLQTFDRGGRVFMRNEFAWGLPMADATGKNDPLSSSPGASSKFFRYTASLSRLQKLPLGTYGILKLQGQASPSRLFSLEQTQIGGAASVRGYQEGRLIGNQGFLTSAEWRIPMRFIPAKLHVGKYQFNQNLELVSFFDAGGVFDSRGAVGVNSQSGRIQRSGFLMGVGVGLRAHLTRFLSARLDVGFPLIKQDPDKDSARVHFGVESRLF
jgi:hemolysin activation/secretion protein